MKKKKVSISNFLCKQSVAGYIFILPFIIGFLVFTIIPMISSLYLSFTDYSILGSPKWVGLKNYIKMFTKDSKYLKSLKVTFFYAFASVPLKLLMALVVAMIMTKKTKLTGQSLEVVSLLLSCGNSFFPAAELSIQFFKHLG